MLLAIGHGSPYLETEVKFFYKDLLKLKEAAVEVASEANWIPGSDIFVFMEYKGEYYAFPTDEDTPCIVTFGSILPLIVNDDLNEFLSQILEALRGD